MDKGIFVNNRHTTYLNANSWKTFKVANELYPQHKEADHKIVSQTVFESKKGNKALAVADDSDIFILLLWVASSFKSDVFFRKRKLSNKDGVIHSEIYPLAEQLGEDVCEELPAFHVLTGSDNTLEAGILWKKKVYLLQENDCASRKPLFFEDLKSSKC